MNGLDMRLMSLEQHKIMNLKKFHVRGTILVCTIYGPEARCSLGSLLAVQ